MLPQATCYLPTQNLARISQILKLLHLSSVVFCEKPTKEKAQGATSLPRSVPNAIDCILGLLSLTFPPLPMAENDLFFVDTHVGHRAHEDVRKALGLWMKDRVNHLSHVLVLRKREVPRTRRVESALAERRAMWEKGVRTGGWAGAGGKAKGSGGPG